MHGSQEQVAPEVANAISEDISEYPDNKECLFCGDGRKIDAVVAIRLRIDIEHSKEIATCVGIAGICVDCAKHGYEKLAELKQEPEFRDCVARLLDMNRHDRRFANKKSKH